MPPHYLRYSVCHQWVTVTLVLRAWAQSFGSREEGVATLTEGEVSFCSGGGNRIKTGRLRMQVMEETGDFF